jgi:hypothetical protein
VEWRYDNTSGNAELREALEERGLEEPVDAGLGEGTLDEMCLVSLGLVY